MDLVKRVLTALVGLPIIIAIVLAGRIPFYALLEVAIVIGILEYSRLLEKIDAKPIFSLTLGFAMGIPIAYGAGGFSYVGIWLSALLAVMLLLSITDFFKISRRRTGATLGGVLYIGLLFAILGMIYDLRHGRDFVLYTLIATWIADTSAYFVGKYFGRNPLAPNISPKKTIEGAVGSIIITATVFGLLKSMPALQTIERVIFGFSLAAAAMTGDLFESFLKRRAGMKDSGQILPGHGGFLDRVDSLLVAGLSSFVLLKVWAV